MKRNCKHVRGFTLVDLLVAIAILTIVMSAVAALLMASVHSVRSGTATIEANEEQRALLGTVERDLTTAFSARDFGKYYQFFGTPIGFSYVGLKRGYDPKVTEKPNVERVTYVLHQTAGHKAYTSPDGTFTTYALVRYVEPNMTDLDSFPVDWQWIRGNIEFPGVDDEFTAIEALAYEGWPDRVVQELLRAKRRQLWIRMLSGGEANLPSAWDLIGKSPRDYIVIQNMLSPAPPVIGDNDKGYVGPVFFEYGLTDASTILWRPFWNADYNVPGTQPFYAGVTDQDPAAPVFQATGPEALANRIGTPFNPRLPEAVKLTATLRYRNPYPGAPDTVRAFERIMDVPGGIMRSAPPGT